MKSAAAARTAGAAALAIAVACTDADLYGTGAHPNFANKISLQGELCTDDPSAVEFPVKVLVVMDGSAEMVAADPSGNRATAVDTLVTKYSGPNYHYGIIQYAAQARSPTGGFAVDATSIQAGIDTIRVGTTQAQRSWHDALRVATTAVQDDILSSSPGRRSRTRYVILFVAYGPPLPDLATAWCSGHALDPASAECQDAFAGAFCPDDLPVPADCEGLLYPRMVRELRQYALDNGAQGLVVHTFALSADPRATSLLTQMATAGYGSYQLQAADHLDLLGADFTAAGSIFVRRELVVYNENAILRRGRVVPDSDGDGMADEEEMTLGTDPRVVDSDADTVGDAVERLLQAPGQPFDPLLPSPPAECTLIDPPNADTDGDGLLDCEEAVLRTDPSLVDSDRDGIPDIVEVRRGGNPLVDDALEDTDRDGVANGDELKGGLDVSSNDAVSELEYGYRYRLFDEGPTTRLEVVPGEPIPGVVVVRIEGSTSGVGAVDFRAGPPSTLAWTDDANQAPGPAVDVSAGGVFVLESAAGRQLTVEVDAWNIPVIDVYRKVLLRVTERFCFHYDVRNITLVETLDAQRPDPGWNTLWIYLAEIPEDTPRGHAIFRAATVPVRFLEPDRKTPDRPFIELGQEDFVLLTGGD